MEEMFIIFQYITIVKLNSFGITAQIPHSGIIDQQNIWTYT